MLAQVTYIQKFIMADSEDEFMPIVFAANTAFVAMSHSYSSGAFQALLVQTISGRAFRTILELCVCLQKLLPVRMSPNTPLCGQSEH